MKKWLIILLLIQLILCVKAQAANPSATNIVESLKTGDDKTIDETIKSLGIEKGICCGFEKIQVIEYWAFRSDERNTLIALSWEPPDGYIVYISHSGRVLSKFRTGYVISVGLQEEDNNKSSDFVVVNGTISYGSGYLDSRFQIFAIGKAGLSKVWEATSYYHSFPTIYNGKIMHGAIDFQYDSSSHTYTLKYDLKTEIYSYKEGKSVLKEVQKKSELYIIKDGKIIKESQKKE